MRRQRATIMLKYVSSLQNFSYRKDGKVLTVYLKNKRLSALHPRRSAQKLPFSKIKNDCLLQKNGITLMLPAVFIWLFID